MTETEQQEQRQKESPLYSERGTTKISDTIVSQIIDIAVNDIEGIRPGKTNSQVGEYEVAVDFNMEMEYGRDLTALTSALRTRISEEVRRMTGLQVIEQNITVTDIFFSDGSDDEDEESEDEHGTREEVEGEAEGETEREALLDADREGEERAELEADRDTEQDTEQEAERGIDRDVEREIDREIERETEQETEQEIDRESDLKPERGSDGEVLLDTEEEDEDREEGGPRGS